MRENDSNWFSKWEDELPPPEDLIPLSQSLITPDLAIAFNISSPHAPPNSSAELDSTEPGGGGSDDTARTLKRPRLVWTPHLHKRFVDAVAHLGIKNAVPKTIMQIMNVEGLTRENVASHLQKYRLYLKRMQSISSAGGRGASGIDSATDRLFASSPVPAHFLHPGQADSVHFLPFVPPSAMKQQQQNEQFEHAFMRKRMGMPIHNSSSNGSIVVPNYVEDLELPNGKKVLTLFPTGDD